jgi:hypothetical protein
MRTIKTYSKRAPFYNAFIDTNPTDEPITCGLLVNRPESMRRTEITSHEPTQSLKGKTPQMAVRANTFTRHVAYFGVPRVLWTAAFMCASPLHWLAPSIVEHSRPSR